MSAAKAQDASDVEQRLAALVTNVNAVQAMAQAVESTIGPKGLDVLLVDRFGDAVITNDGVTILSRMDANHPAARLVINVARAQEQKVGDGTTTATIMAAALLAEGLTQARRGVPVTRIIEGIRLGVQLAQKFIASVSRPVTDLDDPVLRQVALISGRGREDIADLVVEAAKKSGIKKLRDPGFRLAGAVVAAERAKNQVISGIIVDKKRLNTEMPRRVSDVRVLVVDDALEPQKVEDEALHTESGVALQKGYRAEFADNLQKLRALGVGLILVDRGVDPAAEQFLTDAGVMVLSRVLASDLRRAAEFSGARMVKRTALGKPPEELSRFLGHVDEAYEDEELERVIMTGGAGKPAATVLVGAATSEVVAERERIAQDAAGAVQAAVREGVVPGGGSVELAAALAVERARSSLQGMAAYGMSCVAEALRRPLAQIVANAGFNPLEKVGEAAAAQNAHHNPGLGIDCDTGGLVDMVNAGVMDPTLVKMHALAAAAEVAETILRIDTIIKMKDAEEVPGERAPSGG